MFVILWVCPKKIAMIIFPEYTYDLVILLIFTRARALAAVARDGVRSLFTKILVYHIAASFRFSGDF